MFYILYIYKVYYIYIYIYYKLNAINMYKFFMCFIQWADHFGTAVVVTLEATPAW